MSLQQVLDAARTHNPALNAAQQSLQAVQAQEVQAGVRANPSFTLYGTNVTLPAQGASNPYAYSAQVSRLFELGSKRQWRLAAARATTTQTAAQLEDAKRQTVLAVKQAFTAMLLAKALLQLAQDNLKDFQRELAINQERYKAGDIGKLDFERLDLQLAQFESDAANAEANLKQASYQLQTLMGLAQPTDGFDITGDLKPPLIDATLADLDQKAMAARPDLQAAGAAIAAADANVRLANAYALPDPTLEGEYDRSGTYNSAGFSISIPLSLFDRNQGNKATARYQAQSVRFAQSAVANQVHSDVAQAWVSYRAAHALAERYNMHYVDESKDVLSIAQFAYEHGGLALIDYLDALRDYRTTASSALNAYAQTWLAVHQLSAATATELVP
ncbi:MAG: TolC family protein [Acidobacteriota bacterium]|nr:TolC family protein [Acidobacteriota bacterium]